MAQIDLPTTFGAVRGALNDTGLRRNRYGATQAPGAGDNAAEGYEIGSRWTLHHHRRALDPDRVFRRRCRLDLRKPSVRPRSRHG